MKRRTIWTTVTKPMAEVRFILLVIADLFGNVLLNNRVLLNVCRRGRFHVMSYPAKLFQPTQGDIMEQLFSARDICKIFKISLSTLSRRVASGDVPPPRKIYPHSDNRWTKSAIDEVFESMPIADAYKDSTYHGNRAQCA